MSTAVASASVGSLPSFERHSPRYTNLAPNSAAISIERNDSAMAMANGPAATTSSERSPVDGKRSPRLYVLHQTHENLSTIDDCFDRGRSTNAPKIIVKKEPPSSPSLPGTSRHRPRKLDLNTNTSTIPAPLNSRPSLTPMTARDGIGMHDVGLACLSPGFQTQDPTMREQLQRSISVRDQQRSIIESRLLKSAKGDGPESSKALDSSNPFAASNSGSKKRPPPGLSIVPPPAEQFANERIVQSAPLHQTFTGMRQPPPANRHIGTQPSNPSSTSHINHVPAVQTNNRLPPISDVFGQEQLNPGASRPSFYHSNSTQSNGPPMPSPGFPPNTAHPMSQNAPAHTQPQFERPREYRSAEEAVQEMTGGREELLPRIVHYGGHQPPTPPSPHPRSNDGLTPHKYQIQGQEPRSGNSRRRSRMEYEADSSPPLGSQRDRPRYSGPFGESRDSPATQKAKKDEFMSLCARAWDLFHS